MMKISKIAVIFAILGMIFTSGCGGGNSQNEERTVYTINDIQSDPYAFDGEITINGIVGWYHDGESNVFYVKDKNELLFCKNLFCEAFALPSVYKGSQNIMPDIADEINMTGAWGEYTVENNTFLVFEITEIEVVQNIKDYLTQTDWEGLDS
jgi:hypothetical protein